MDVDDRKVWLVPHPTSQFKENVKKLAVRAQLIIVDARFEKDIDPSRIASGDEVPKLTPVKKAKAEAKADA